MNPTTIAIIGIIVLVLIFLLRMPVAVAMGVVGFVGFAVASSMDGALRIVAKDMWATFSSYSLSVAPMFVLMGTIAFYSGISSRLFDAANKWLGRLPGGLSLATIAACAGFGAMCGSTTAAAAAMGKVTLPEMKRYGYNDALRTGCVASAGSLAIMIPPSTVLIIYGVMTEQSIGKLFIAGIIPGILLIAFLSIPAIAMAYLRPGLAPKGYKVSWRERWRSLRTVWPIVVVMASILGAIYGGIATATETAGVGVVVALIIAVVFFKMRWKQLKEALKEAALINGMILFIIFAANFFTYVLGSTNVASGLEELVGSSGLNRWVVIVIINVIILILGCILDPITITLLTIPIFIPLIVSLGFDPIWFTVMFCINTQIGLVTPPMGTDLFAVRTIFNIPTGEIIRGVAPFMLCELVFLAVIVAFPQLSLWLPSLMVGS